MAQTEPTTERWSLDPDFGITWQVVVGAPPHEDEVEMSGRKVSLIVHYGVDQAGRLVLQRRAIWPTLRTLPNNTRGSLIQTYDLASSTTQILVDGSPIGAETPRRFRLNGFLEIESGTDSGLTLIRTIFPSPDRRAALERITLKNPTAHPVSVTVNPLYQLDYGRGTKGVYLMEVRQDALVRVDLQPGESTSFAITISARTAAEAAETYPLDMQQAGRQDFIQRVTEQLRFECPDPAISRLFDFAKVRTSESIFETASGLMHSPGGGAYYAATWCNDQCEYANPFFPFLGEPTANASALNCYRQYMPFMAGDFTPIPSSIIAEGLSFWEGEGDRGDAAMYAYGAARYALALGDPQVARELLPAIDWCLEYCQRQKTSEGVIASDSDELEGRFSHGKTNLATSSLAYGALRSAAHLAQALNLPDQAAEYTRRADYLEQAIDRVFAANIHGFETYRYHEGLELLRSWICLPLVMGIFTRREGTADALFSPYLWTDDGLRTVEGDQTFWDRSTLYGLRGVFYAGQTERAFPFFRAYSHRRLLGEHVPYPVEAYPEGNQRHLAAESALYCRIITEGLFGITPTGLDSFNCTPRLPAAWDSVALKDIHAFGAVFSLSVSRADDGCLMLRMAQAGGREDIYSLQPGETLHLQVQP